MDDGRRNVTISDRALDSHAVSCQQSLVLAWRMKWKEFKGKDEETPWLCCLDLASGYPHLLNAVKCDRTPKCLDFTPIPLVSKAP